MVETANSCVDVTVFLRSNSKILDGGKYSRLGVAIHGGARNAQMKRDDLHAGGG
jgi:hypothetical protein